MKTVSSDRRMITRLMFRLLPIQILLAAVAMVNGITLGLGKAVNGRFKNKYPKGLRTLAWKDLQI